MQTLPMLLVRTRTPGILWINGHLAGAAEDTLVLPVSPTGEALVQLFPYGSICPRRRGCSFTGAWRWPVRISCCRIR